MQKTISITLGFVLVAFTWPCSLYGDGPAGADTEVQYKDGTVFGGADGLTYDDSSEATNSTILNNVRYAHMHSTGGDGTSSDPWTGWESAVAANTVLHFAAGYYETSTGINVTTLEGVTISGDGMHASIIGCTSASGDCLKVDNTSAASTTDVFTLRDIRFEQKTNALATDKVVVNFVFSASYSITNLWIDNGGAALVDDGIALAVKDSNHGVIQNLNIQGTDTDRWKVCLDLHNGVTSNRGNQTIVGGLLDRCAIGIRVAEGVTATLVNNIQILGTKMVVEGSEKTVPSTIGIELNTQAENIVIDGVHLEAYVLGIDIDSAQQVTVANTLISEFGATTGDPENGSNDGDGIVVRATSERVFIVNNRLTDGDDVGTGITLADTTVQNVVVRHNRILKNTSTDLTNAIDDNSNNAVLILHGGMNHQKYKEYTFGRGIAESVTFTFDLDTDQALQWDEANNWMEFSSNFAAGNGTGRFYGGGYSAEASSGMALSIGKTEDSERWRRLQVDETGAVSWGDGSNAGAGDTNLYRPSPDILKTDDSMIVGADVTVQGGGLIIGNNDAGDKTITFDENGTDGTLTWSDADDQFELDQRLRLTSGIPQILFHDTDSGDNIQAGAFRGLDVPDAGFGTQAGAFDINARWDSGSGVIYRFEWVETASGQNGFKATKHAASTGNPTSTTDIETYTGSNGWWKHETAAPRYEWSKHPYFSETDGGAIFVSPDGSCSKCGPDNSDSWTCSSVTCP